MWLGRFLDGRQANWEEHELVESARLLDPHKGPITHMTPPLRIIVEDRLQTWTIGIYNHNWWWQPAVTVGDGVSVDRTHTDFRLFDWRKPAAR